MVEGGIEAGNLQQIGKESGHCTDRGDGLRLLYRSQGDQGLNSLQNILIDPNRLSELGAPVRNLVADRQQSPLAKPLVQPSLQPTQAKAETDIAALIVASIDQQFAIFRPRHQMRRDAYLIDPSRQLLFKSGLTADFEQREFQGRWSGIEHQDRVVHGQLRLRQKGTGPPVCTPRGTAAGNGCLARLIITRSSLSNR